MSYGICKPIVTGPSIPVAPTSTYYTSYNPPVTNSTVQPGAVTSGRVVENLGRFYWFQNDADPYIEKDDIFGSPEVIKGILYEFRDCVGNATALDARSYPLGTLLRPVGEIKVEGTCPLIINPQ